MATLIFKKEKITTLTREAAKRGVNRCAMALVRDIRKALNEPYPPASTPGEYPHKRTGNLRKAIDWWEDPDAIAAEVGANVDAPYWSDLEYGTSEMAPRPFVRPRVAALREGDFQQIVGEELALVFKS